MAALLLPNRIFDEHKQCRVVFRPKSGSFVAASRGFHAPGVTLAI